MELAWAQPASAAAPRIRTSTLRRPAFSLSNVYDLKQIALEIFQETLAGIDIPLAMRQKLARAGSRIHFQGEIIDLADYKSIVAIGLGKASVAMARGFAELLGTEFAFEGILVTPHESVAEVPRFRVMTAGHPIPDEGSIAAAGAIVDLLSR